MENVSNCVWFVPELPDLGGKGNFQLLSWGIGADGAKEMFCQGKSQEGEAD